MKWVFLNIHYLHIQEHVFYKHRIFFVNKKTNFRFLDKRLFFFSFNLNVITLATIFLLFALIDDEEKNSNFFFSVMGFNRQKIE